MKPGRRNNEIAEMADASPRSLPDGSREPSIADMDNPREKLMAFVIAKRPAALMLGAGALALAVGAANAAPLVKECGKNGNFVIGFSQANNAEPYRQHVNDELTAAAKKVPQFTLQIADGAGNVNTQTSQMDNFITQKVDLILISPFEAAPLTPVVARAMKAGIPVIELDRKTVGDPGKDYTAFIGGDNFKIAQEAGKYVADKLLPERRRGRGARGLAEFDPGGRAAQRLQGRGQGQCARSWSSPSRRPTGCRTKPRPPSPQCSRPIRTSRRSTPATT